GHSHECSSVSVHTERLALVVLRPRRHRRGMEPVVTRSHIARAGLTRSGLDDALACCLIRVRRGIYALRPGCTAAAHGELRRLIDDVAASRFADIDRSDLRGATARLRFLAHSYGGSLPDDCVLTHLSAALLWDLPLTR